MSKGDLNELPMDVSRKNLCDKIATKNLISICFPRATHGTGRCWRCFPMCNSCNSWHWKMFLMFLNLHSAQKFIQWCRYIYQHHGASGSGDCYLGTDRQTHCQSLSAQIAPGQSEKVIDYGSFTCGKSAFLTHRIHVCHFCGNIYHQQKTQMLASIYHTYGSVMGNR